MKLCDQDEVKAWDKCVNSICKGLSTIYTERPRSIVDTATNLADYMIEQRRKRIDVKPIRQE